ncbi:O-antigen ligase family protein [Lachnospiraceae bacterium 45-W7]
MKQKKSMMYIFMEGTAALYAISMLVLFPLFYANNYIDISTAKLSFFRVCAIAMPLLFFLFAGMGWLQQYKESVRQNAKNYNKKKKAAAKQEGSSLTKKEIVRQWLSGVSAPSWFAVVFVAGVCIATIFSVDPLESWQGLEGRKLGLQVFLLCVISYMLVGKYLRPGKWLIWTFFAGNTIVFVLAILNFWAVDPLGMYENLVTEQHESFISTIGNVNACSSYLCMVMPAAMALYTVVKTKALRVATGIFLVLGFWTCYCTRSGSWLLGVGAAFLVLLWFAICDHSHMQRFLEICGLFWFSSLLMEFSVLIGDAVGSKGLMFLGFKRERLQSGGMLNGYVLFITGILILGGLLFLKSREKKQQELPYRTLRIWIFSILAIIFGIGVLLVAIANLKPGGWEGTLSFLNRLKIQDYFGSRRGYIWKTTVRGWLQLPLWDKITGYGLNCYHMFIEQYGGDSVTEMFNGARLVDAHNELLQFLTTTGLLGVVGYFGLLIGTAVRAAKRYVKSPVMVLGVAVVCGYLAQAMVNNPTAFLTPYLFLMLGIIKSLENLENVKE